MKTTKHSSLISAVIFMVLLISACNWTKNPKMVTVPFSADALGEYKYAGPDTLPNPKCTGDLSAWRAIVDVKGSGTPIGNFTGHFDFCGDTVSHYGNVYAYLIAENGDTLFINTSGQVLPGRLEEHPEFVTSYWKDTIDITGGTGKYKEATGKVISDDYNSSEDPYSHHHWTGSITMLEEKK